MSNSLHSAAFDLVPTLASLLNQAHQALDRNSGDARACLDEASDLLQRLNADHAAGQDASALVPWQVRRLRNHVEANLDQTLSVLELATVIHRSRSYFSRIFRASFGLSPHAYVMQRRLARAKAMMRGTNDSLAQIAASCGFADQAHFCRMFRGATGCTPREWRRRQGHAGAAAVMPSAAVHPADGPDCAERSDLQNRRTLRQAPGAAAQLACGIRPV